jgi:hypothetical protein
MEIGAMEKERHGAPLVKLLCGLLYPADRPSLMDRARAMLEESFGDIERESESFAFCCTDYYRDISPELSRCFFSFEGLVSPELVRWKKTAIALESSSASVRPGGGRLVNIDPGYIDGARLVLASTKDNAHRIYIGGGIFAEATLCRRKSRWESFSYTFPDFKSGIYDAFLETARQDWLKDIRERRKLMERA